MRKVVIHIGIHKTGSSAIQNALYASRETLLAQGILYPSCGANLSKQFRVMLREPDHKRIARRRTRNLTSLTSKEEILDLFHRDLSTPEWQTAILSAESLDAFDFSTARALIEWVDNYAEEKIVVAFVRHPVEWVRSVCQQRLYATNTTLDTIYENLPRPSWKRKLMPWINVVGSKNFRLVSYDEARLNGDLLGKFLDAGGIPRDPVLSTVEIGKVNTSMSHEAVLMMDSINRQKLLRDRDLRQRRALVEAIRRSPGQRFQLPQGVAKAAKVRSIGDVSWLQNRFAVDWFSDVFYDAVGDYSVKSTRLPRSTIDSMVREMVENWG